VFILANEIKSKKYSGVFYRELNNGDRSYFLRIRIGGKIKRFPIGKKSEGITEAFCNQEKIRLVNEYKFGAETSDKLMKVTRSVPSFAEMVDFFIRTSTASEGTKKETAYLKNESFAAIANPTKNDIQEFLIKELSRIKPATVNLKMKRIRSVYKHAIASGYYNGEDPTFGLKPFKGEEARRRFLSLQEVEMLLEALKDKPRHYLFVKLALCTGARSGSILRIHRNDVKDDGRVLLFNEKTDKHYYGFLDEETFNLLKDKKGYVLALKGQEDAPAKRYGICGTIQLIMDELFNPEGTKDLDRVVIHTLRHSVATQMLKRGVPIEVISKTLDHASLAVTAKFYAKISQDVVRDSVRGIWN
jgi:integrase